MARRPRPFAVGRVRVRVHSGPRSCDGRWRWRADRPAGASRREPVWSGWGDRDEAEAAVLDALRTRGESHVDASDVRTVFDLLAVWRGEVDAGDRSPRTTAARRGCAERLGASSALGLVLLDRLDRRALERYARGPGAASTRAQDLRALRSAWLWARERGVVPAVDLPLVRVPRGDAVYSRYTPSPAEVAAVLDWLRPRTPWAHRAVYLLYVTGCRPGEVASLTWDRVDAVRGRLVVGGKMGRRTVHVHADVAAELGRWTRAATVAPTGRPGKAPRGDTVTGARGATVRSRLHDHLVAATEALSLPRWSPYGLRRAAVVALYRRGEDPSVAAAALGHSAAVALRHYRAVDEGDLARAVLPPPLSSVLSEPGPE